MAFPEIDSFVLKYKNLLLAGIDANLTIISQAGKAVLTLTAEVDVSHPHPRHVGAARVRRRERRAAERAAAGDAICVAGNVPAEDANPNSAAEEAVNETDVEDNVTGKVIEPVEDTKKVQAT